jgi:tetratricopeptide (TPR) repeat protein
MSSKRKMRRRSAAAGQMLEIVHGPIPQAWHSQLASEIREAMPRLHALVNEDPRAAVAELRAWIEREPLPMFYNWLSAAYSALGESEAVDDLVRENYRRNPQYLFARLNYAEVCIHGGDLAGAREALGARFDLRPLLGGRKRAHISEVTGYFYAVGLYHLAAGDLDAAERAYELLKNVAPDEPFTGELGRMLYARLRDVLSKLRFRL